MALLSLLLGFAFWLFRRGTVAWQHAAAQAELQAEAQKLEDRISREVERSIYASVSVDPPGPAATAFSLLSPVRDDGSVALETFRQQPEWKQYLIFYHDPAQQVVRLRSLPVAAGAPESSNGEPIERFDEGGLLPLQAYRSGGRVLARFVRRFETGFDNGLMRLDFVVEKPRYQRNEVHQLQLRLVTLMRN